MLYALLPLPFLFSLYWIFFQTPIEATQGAVQKIFYLHLSCAITMYCAFFIAFLSSILYLAERKSFWERHLHVAAELGLFFCTAVLCTGPIWAKPIWNTWWTWEPRLTTTVILFMLFFAQRMVFKAMEDSPRRGMICAVVAIVAFLDVPLVHYSVKLWRGIHPQVIKNSSGLPLSMKITLILTLCSTLMLFACLYSLRYKIFKAEESHE